MDESKFVTKAMGMVIARSQPVISKSLSEWDELISLRVRQATLYLRFVHLPTFRNFAPRVLVGWNSVYVSFKRATWQGTKSIRGIFGILNTSQKNEELTTLHFWGLDRDGFRWYHIQADVRHDDVTGNFITIEAQTVEVCESTLLHLITLPESPYQIWRQLGDFFVDVHRELGKIAPQFEREHEFLGMFPMEWGDDGRVLAGTYPA